MGDLTTLFQRVLHRLRLSPLTLLSGILIVFAFPPWNFSIFILVGLVPWLFEIQKSRTLREVLFQSYWIGSLMAIGGFHWVAGAIHEFGELPWLVSLLVFALYTLICQPQFWFFGPFCYWVFRTKELPGWQRILLLLAAYLALDGIFPKLFCDTLGHSLAQWKDLRQTAEISGTSTLTAVVVLCNLAIWNFVDSKWIRRRLLAPALIVLGCSLVVLLIGYSWGHHRRLEIEQRYSQPDSTVTFAMIQGNIGNFEKVASESGFVSGGDQVVQKYLDLSKKALLHKPKPHAIVWPETAYPSAFRVPRTSYELMRDQRLDEFVRQNQVHLFFGGYDHRGGQDFNALHFLQLPLHPDRDPEGVLQTYHKVLLLPFAEAFPGAETWPWLKRALPQIANFGRGPGPEIYPVQFEATQKPTQIGPSICYEILKPAFIRSQILKGAQLLLNVTNDSWFGGTTEPYQHLVLASIRAIEGRVPYLRSTNTGITTYVTPTGEITLSAPMNEEAIYSVSVPVLNQPPSTLFLKWGDWISVVAVLGTLLPCGTLIWRRERKKKGSLRA